MAHILNKLTGVKFEDIKNQLEKDKQAHAEQGMYLEHLWTNDDNPNEVYFLFRVDDLNKCKQLIEKVYEQARKENPHVPLPEKLYLKEE